MKKFLQGLYFHEFRELNLKCENKTSRNILHLFINEKFVPPKTLKSKTTCTSVHAKLLNLEDLSLQAMTISTWSRQNITANISKASHVLGEHSFI